ncbi:MAG: hypothetical protein ACOH5I_12010 [Oligoflexus sp.]
MSTAQGIFGAWDNPNIIYISSDTSRVPEEITDRLSRRGWKIAVSTGSILRGFKALYEGKGSVLLVGDTPELPAILTLRNQVSDPLAILTPTIVACSEENAADKAHLIELGTPEIIDYPLNPAKFVETLEWVLRRWNQGQLRKLTEAKNNLLKRRPAESMKILTQVIGVHEIIPMAVPCLGHFIRKQTNPKTVEKILLNALKEHPRNLGILIAMVDFYLKVAMPETALKLIGVAKKNHGNPRIIVPEQIQALLMMNRVHECIPLLEIMKSTGFMPQTAKNFLMRCLYTEGLTDRFERMAEGQTLILEQFQKQWTKQTLSESA